MEGSYEDITSLPGKKQGEFIPGSDSSKPACSPLSDPFSLFSVTCKADHYVCVPKWSFPLAFCFVCSQWKVRAVRLYILFLTCSFYAYHSPLIAAAPPPHPHHRAAPLLLVPRWFTVLAGPLTWPSPLSTVPRLNFLQGWKFFRAVIFDVALPRKEK